MKPLWPEWMHGYLRSRGSEDSELVHRTTGELLRAAEVAHISNPEDMSNAVACTGCWLANRKFVFCVVF